MNLNKQWLRLILFAFSGLLGCYIFSSFLPQQDPKTILKIYKIAFLPSAFFWFLWDTLYVKKFGDRPVLQVLSTVISTFVIVPVFAISVFSFLMVTGGL